MKNFLLALICLLTFSASGASQFNRFTTNADNATINGNTLVNVDAIGRQIVFNPPHVGEGATRFCWEGGGGIASGADVMTNGIIFSAPAGSNGIVRSIVFETGRDVDWTNRNNIRLRIYVDCGTSVNSDGSGASQFLAFDAPFGTLNGDRFRYGTNGAFDITRNGMYVDTIDQLPESVLDYPVLMFRVNMPAVFTNGVIVQLYDATNSAVWNHGYTTVQYEFGIPSFAFSNYRLRSKQFFGLPAIADASTTNTLFTLTGPGIIAGLMQSFYYDVNTSPPSNQLEFPLRFISSSARWAASGGDDVYLNSFSFTMTREHLGYGFGTTHNYNFYDTDTQTFDHGYWENYRFFAQDAFIWNNGLTVQWQAPPYVGHDLIMLYYAP